SVFMNEQISKANGLDHFFSQFGRQVSVLFHEVEHLIDTAGDLGALFTHNMSGNVYAILDRHLKIEAHNVLVILIVQKCFKIMVAFLAGSP
ncbi:MAG TPA: hypothetical protein PKV86_16070, partial [Syntrophobacteraceae bacterium]|nr:hypothetical protein [Syntrophobacteraceae bacterium]